MVTQISRIFKNLFSTSLRVHRALSTSAKNRIQEAIAESEKSHSGELQCVVEASLSIGDVIEGIDARQRAVNLFSELRLWDTELNNGVLIYLLFSERQIEIVSDRGISNLVPPNEWEKICHSMENELRKGDFEKGILLGIEKVTKLLEKHFPLSNSADKNELSDKPVFI